VRGVPLRTQRPQLQRTPQVVVGTPGRILDHLRRKTVNLRSLAVLVLDEADRMLDMGFNESITEVVAQTRATRQTMLFSATFPQPVRVLSRKFQNKPVEVTVDLEASEVEIDQIFYQVNPERRMAALVALLREHAPETTLVFCHTRNDTRDVARMLEQDGFSVLALHGQLEQRERDEVLLRFAHRSCSCCRHRHRGARLDIKGLAAVISWSCRSTPTCTCIASAAPDGPAPGPGSELVLAARADARGRDRKTNGIARALGQAACAGRLGEPGSASHGDVRDRPRETGQAQGRRPPRRSDRRGIQRAERAGKQGVPAERGASRGPLPLSTPPPTRKPNGPPEPDDGAL